MDSTYYDEDYFQNGPAKGTAYINYLANARTNPTFHEIVRTLFNVFEPRRTLELGCATGIMVKYFNELGSETYGIDISEWAVQHREHSNVALGDTTTLCFPDNHFDLVYSCHFLEHLNDAELEGTLSEIQRTCSRWQFHMLPVLGRPPYDGERKAVIENLRKDPTHQQLHEMSWWERKIGDSEGIVVPLALYFFHDNEGCELTNGQLCAMKGSNQNIKPVSERALHSNRAVWGKMRDALSKTVRQGRIREDSNPFNQSVRIVFEKKEWRDVCAEFNQDNLLNLVDNSCLVLMRHKGRRCSLRLAIGQDIGLKPFEHCAEIWFELDQGIQWFLIMRKDFRILRGNPDLSRINRIAFGGEARQCTIDVCVIDSQGRMLLDI